MSEPRRPRIPHNSQGEESLLAGRRRAFTATNLVAETRKSVPRAEFIGDKGERLIQRRRQAKCRLSIPNYPPLFFSFSFFFSFLETWTDERWVSDICQPLLFLSSYNVKCKWAHASRRDVRRGAGGEIFSLNMRPRSVNRTVTLRNWEFWLIESPPLLPPPLFFFSSPSWSSYTNLEKRRSGYKPGDGARWILFFFPKEFNLFKNAFLMAYLSLRPP